MSSATRLRETIAECLSDLQSSSSSPEPMPGPAPAPADNHHRRRQKALQTLVTITKISPHHRNLVAAQTNLIPILASLITKSSSSSSSSRTLELSHLSLSILFNLSLNPNLKQSLAQMENIVHLNSSLILSLSLPSSESESAAESTKLVASLLCSLAMLDKNKAKFGVAGTIQILISAISASRSRKTTASHHLHHHHILATLMELVQFQGNCTLAVRSGAIPLLIQILVDHGEDLSGTALAILCLLARFEEGLSEIKKTDGIVEIILQVLKGKCMMSKENGAEILIRIFDEKCLIESLRFHESLMSVVVADLSVRGSTKAREKATVLMKKIMIMQQQHKQ